jgi:TRAP transporter 4TM/12TM fusion protein
LLPAVLYYITLSTSVAAYAHKHKIPVKQKEEGEETTGEIFKKGWFYFLPIIVLIALLIMGISTQRAALITIVLCIVIGLLTDRKKFTAKNLIELCESSAKSIMTVSIACMIAGIIVGSINITGFGLKISGLITAASGGHIFVMGVLAAIVCIILGMGLPTSACYIVLAVLVAPAMVSLGISTISSHMFILYYGVVAAITPPVALAIFAAIGISGGDMWKTGLQALKLAAAGFVIPFIFLYNNDLVMYHPATDSFGFSAGVVLAFVTAAIGCMFMAVALFRWCFRDLKWFESVILLICGVLLMLNEPLVLNLVGFVVGIVVVVLAKASSKKKEVVTV